MTTPIFSRMIQACKNIAFEVFVHKPRRQAFCAFLLKIGNDDVSGVKNALAKHPHWARQTQLDPKQTVPFTDMLVFTSPLLEASVFRHDRVSHERFLIVKQLLDAGADPTHVLNHRRPLNQFVSAFLTAYTDCPTHNFDSLNPALLKIMRAVVLRLDQENRLSSALEGNEEWQQWQRHNPHACTQVMEWAQQQVAGEQNTKICAEIQPFEQSPRRLRKM